MEVAARGGWRGRRGLLNAQAPGGLMAPVALPKHERTHYPLVAALLILMAVAVAAICCCCWQWEGHMRLHARRLRGHHSHHNSHTTSAPSSSTSSSQEFPGAPPRVSSQVSVLMPGDDIPRFIAWSVPQGSPPAAAIPADEVRKPPQQVSEPDLKVADI